MRAVAVTDPVNSDIVSLAVEIEVAGRRKLQLLAGIAQTADIRTQHHHPKRWNAVLIYIGRYIFDNQRVSACRYRHCDMKIITRQQFSGALLEPFTYLVSVAGRAVTVTSDCHDWLKNLC